MHTDNHMHNTEEWTSKRAHDGIIATMMMMSSHSNDAIITYTLDFCRTFVASGVLAMVAKRDHFMHIAPIVDHMYGCSGYHSIMKV